MNIKALRDKVRTETETLTGVLNNIREHNRFLLGQLDAYKEYLKNVREIAYTTPQRPASRKKKNKFRTHVQGPFRFSYTQLEKDGVIVEAVGVPEDKYVYLASPLHCLSMC